MSTTSVVVARFPDCDIHKYHFKMEGVTAKIDGAQTLTGQWANMCLPCFERYGVGLGMGKGQQLVLNQTHEHAWVESGLLLDGCKLMYCPDCNDHAESHRKVYGCRSGQAI